MDTITILLADDHKIMREGLRELIETQRPGMEIVAEAKDGRTAVELAIKYRPRLALLDIGMPLLNGIDATRQIREKAPGVKVIALSMHAERHIIVEMLNAGASGYILKDCAFEELLQSIRTVIKGGSFLSPQLVNMMVKDYASLFPDRTDISKLTSRAREVLQLIAEGKTMRDIAAELAISQKTVETLRMRITKKVGIRDVANLTKYAIRNGITSIDTK